MAGCPASAMITSAMGQQCWEARGQTRIKGKEIKGLVEWQSKFHTKNEQIHEEKHFVILYNIFADRMVTLHIFLTANQ